MNSLFKNMIACSDCEAQLSYPHHGSWYRGTVATAITSARPTQRLLPMTRVTREPRLANATGFTYVPALSLRSHDLRIRLRSTRQPAIPPPAVAIFVRARSASELRAGWLSRLRCLRRRLRSGRRWPPRSLVLPWGHFWDEQRCSAK